VPNFHAWAHANQLLFLTYLSERDCTLLTDTFNVTASPLGLLRSAGAAIIRKKNANHFLICAFTLCVAMEGWTSNGINVELMDISGNIGVSADEASWIISAYSAGSALAILTSHNICKILGERIYIIFAALLFAASSAGCALSTSVEPLIDFRLLQGLAAGAFMSRTLVLLVTHFNPSERGKPLRYYLLILFSIGRVAAPALCGYFTDRFSWRSLFWADVLVALIATWFFCIAPRHEKLIPPPSRRNLHFDFIGVALLTLGVAGLQVVMSRSEVDNWFDSALIRTAFILGIFGNAAFVAWQLSAKNRYPLVQIRHALTRQLFSVVLLGVCLGTLFSAIIYVYPYYLRTAETHSAFQTGCLVSVMGLPMLGLALNAPLYTNIVTKLGGRSILRIGLFLEIASSVLMILIMTGDTPDIYLLPSLVLGGSFIAVTAVGLAVAGFAGIPPRRISNARTIYFGARQLGNSIGISLGVILLDRRQAFHSQRLFESYFLNNRFALANVQNLDMQAGIEAFGKSVLRQASILSYQDMFVAIAAVCIITLLSTQLLPGKQKVAQSAEVVSDDAIVEDTSCAQKIYVEAGRK
jgi:EmrB/QacA subfamily drug resistance transporter